MGDHPDLVEELRERRDPDVAVNDGSGAPIRHASDYAYDDVLSSPTSCFSRLGLNGFDNRDSPSRTGTFVISHADHHAATCGSGSQASQRPAQGQEH